MSDITWRCQVCGRERPDAKIWVFKQEITAKLGMPADGREGIAHRNVRYCIDTPGCWTGVIKLAADDLVPRTVHELKCWPSPFQAMLDGIKTFEFRKADRDYEVGNYLLLREWLPYSENNESGKGEFTGRVLRRLVTYVLRGPSFGVPEGYVVLSVVEEVLTNMSTLMADVDRTFDDE